MGQMNVEKVKDLRARLNEYLGKFDENVVVNVGNATFSGTSVTFKVTATEKNEDGTIELKEARDFTLYAVTFGLKPEDLGKTFLSSGIMYKIVGLKPRKSKFPILAQNLENNKNYCFPSDIVKIRLEQ